MYLALAKMILNNMTTAVWILPTVDIILFSVSRSIISCTYNAAIIYNMNLPRLKRKFELQPKVRTALPKFPCKMFIDRPSESIYLSIYLSII